MNSRMLWSLWKTPLNAFLLLLLAPSPFPRLGHALVFTSPLRSHLSHVTGSFSLWYFDSPGSSCFLFSSAYSSAFALGYPQICHGGVNLLWNTWNTRDTLFLAHIGPCLWLLLTSRLAARCHPTSYLYMASLRFPLLFFMGIPDAPLPCLSCPFE